MGPTRRFWHSPWRAHSQERLRAAQQVSPQHSQPSPWAQGGGLRGLASGTDPTPGGEVTSWRERESATFPPQGHLHINIRDAHSHPGQAVQRLAKDSLISI